MTITKATNDRYSKSNPDDAWVFSKYGDKAVRKANKSIDEIAKRISVMDGGDRCEYIEISQRCTSKEAFLFADFTDGVRMWFRSSDLDNPKIASWRGPSAAFPWPANAN